MRTVMSEPPLLEERKEGRVREREGEEEGKRGKTAGRENGRKGRKGGRWRGGATDGLNTTTGGEGRWLRKYNSGKAC